MKKNPKKKKFDNTKLAPIALFVYNRIDHLKKTIKSLKQNKLSIKSDLIIFSDYAKNKNDIKNVLEVRKYIKKLKGFKKIEIYERNKNFGLSKNIISGVSMILKKYKNIIVIEDDLILDKFFLNFMNDGLKLFKNHKKIASIHGYIYPANFSSQIPDYFFFKGADCWGWATWKRSWNIFEKNGKKLKNFINQKNLKKEFNFNGSYNYYKMLVEQIKGKNDSWAIRWYASAFIKQMYTLYPKKTFVKNIGTDGSGTHGAGNREVNKKSIVRKKYTEIKLENKKISENLQAKKKVEEYFRKNSLSLFQKIIKKFIK